MYLVNPHSHNIPAKTMIFIDGGYLKKWIKDGWNTEPEKFPFGTFVFIMVEKALIKLEHATIIRMYFYDGLADTSDNEYEEQKKFFDHLETDFPNFEVRRGRLIRDGDGGFRQKGVDVLMGIDMVDKANQNQYEIAIVVAGDLDHLEAIQTVKRKGKQVFGIYYKGSTSEELRKSFDYDFELKKELIAEINARSEFYWKTLKK